MDIDATLARVERLKKALVDYALSPGFARRMAALREKPNFRGTSMEDHVEAVEALIFEGGDGREPLLQRYLRTNKNLDPQDRAAYEAWYEGNVFGAFRIEQRRGPELLLHNLIDEMDYRTYAAAGVDANNPAPRDGYAIVRLVPTGNIWTISGNVRLFGPRDRAGVEDFAVNLLQQFPRLPFRNPDKLDSARAMVAEQHRVFTETFGSHAVTGTGAEVIGAYRTFMDRLNREHAGQDPSDAQAARSGEEIAPDSNFPAEFRESDDVVLFHHPVKSTSFLVGYRAARDAHRVPPAHAGDPAAERVRDFVYDHSVPAHILEDLAAQFPDTVNEAYRVAFSDPGFDWKNDGGHLLMEHKPTDISDAGIPEVMSVPTSLRAALLRQVAGV